MVLEVCEGQADSHTMGWGEERLRPRYCWAELLLPSSKDSCMCVWVDVPGSPVGLELSAFNAGALGFNPSSGELRSHKLHSEAPNRTKQLWGREGGEGEPDDSG